MFDDIIKDEKPKLKLKDWAKIVERIAENDAEIWYAPAGLNRGKIKEKEYAT